MRHLATYNGFYILFFTSGTEAELPGGGIVHVFLLRENLRAQSHFFRCSGEQKGRNSIVFLYPTDLGLPLGPAHSRGRSLFGGQTEKDKDWISRSGFDNVLFQPPVLRMHHSAPVLPTESGGPGGFRTEWADGLSCGLSLYGLWWRAVDEQRIGRANRPISFLVGSHDEIEFSPRIDSLVVAAQDHDAPTGSTNTDASPLCGWKVRNDIIGTKSVADFPTGRGPSVLCGHGAATGCRNIRIYNIVDYLQLFHELFHALSLDFNGSTLSNAGRNSVP